MPILTNGLRTDNTICANLFFLSAQTISHYIGDIEDTYRSSRPVLSGISAIIQREDILLFKLEKADKEGNHYGIFHYPTKEIRRFKDLDALRGELKPDFPLDFESLEKAYNDYWKSPKQK